MTKDRINWDRVNAYMTRSKTRAVLKPYGIPDITNPFTSAYADVDVAPRWPISEEVAISVALTGGFFMTRHNPAQPIKESEIMEAGRACMRAGASALHIHVRNEMEFSILDLGRFITIIEPLRDEFEDLYVSAGEVAIGPDDWNEMIKISNSGLITGSPVNTTATFCGDTLFAKPPAVMIEKTRILMEAGVKPEIAVYTDADVDNARRYLIESGLVDEPLYWVILPALPGGSPMHNPRQMIQGLTRIVDSIMDIDPDSIISVCAAGRPSVYLVTLAMLMGLHVRLGMEDTVWRYPNRRRADFLQSGVVRSGDHHCRAAWPLPDVGCPLPGAARGHLAQENHGKGHDCQGEPHDLGASGAFTGQDDLVHQGDAVGHLVEETGNRQVGLGSQGETSETDRRDTTDQHRWTGAVLRKSDSFLTQDND